MRRLITFLYLLAWKMATRPNQKPGKPRVLCFAVSLLRFPNRLLRQFPLPSFGCQGNDIPTPSQGFSGRNILKDSSSSSRESTSEAPSEDSDRSVEQRPVPKNSARTPKGSVGKALQEKRRRQNMLGAVELCNSAMQVDAHSADDTSDVSVMHDMADRAVLLATSRQAEPTAPMTTSSPANSAQTCAPPPPPPPPPSTGTDYAPTAPPKYAGDALLTTSGQDVHTELVLSRVVGGAASVKLNSWQTRVILKASPEQDIERNMLALVRLCTAAGTHPPPTFELRYFATVMCQYTGDATQMFARVRCLESKVHVYWFFELRELFVPHEDLSAEQRNLFYFAHGSDTQGIEGMIHSRFKPPATLVDGPEAAGHYSQAERRCFFHSDLRPSDKLSEMAMPGHHSGLHQHTRIAFCAQGWRWGRSTAAMCDSWCGPLQEGSQICHAQR